MQNFDLNDDEVIVENDGPVPAWFNILFAVTVVIGVAYGIHYHFIDNYSTEKYFQEQVDEHKRKYGSITAELNKDGTNPFRGQAKAIAKGEKVFKHVCATCHGPDGKGLIGPNLMDNKWLHGATDKITFNLIMEGIDIKNVKQKQVPPKAGPMPPHKDSLKAKKTLEVMAYLASQNPSMKKK